MSSIESVHLLLKEWEEIEAADEDVTLTLQKLADVIEMETEKYLKKDPDPFDNRHPCRLQPESIFGHVLKMFSREEGLVTMMVRVYSQLENRDLNVVTCRLLLDVLPGLENAVFREEGFVSSLFVWGEHTTNPLRSYAIGLLAAAMNISDVASKYKEKNSAFVPLMLRRIRSLQLKFFDRKRREREKKLRLKMLYSRLNDKASTSTSDNYVRSQKSKKRKLDSSECDVLPAENSSSHRLDKVNPVKARFLNDGSNSRWIDLQQYMIGTFQIYPLTLAGQQKYVLHYLTSMAENHDFLGYIFEENVLCVILQYINIKQNPDTRLAFDALKYLASLLCHKKIAIDFINSDGVQLLLTVPFPSLAATGVSLCLHNLSQIEEALEKICNTLPPNIIFDLVSYALRLLKSSHESSRCHATSFFGLAFRFCIILAQFDEQGGLRKLFNVMSTLDIFVSENVLSEERMLTNHHTVKHVCTALKRYFEAHLVTDWDYQGSLSSSDIIMTHNKPYKALNLSSGNVDSYLEKWREKLSLTQTVWKPVEQFLALDGVYFLLDLLILYFGSNYQGRFETIKNALDVLKFCSLMVSTQLLFCEKKSNREEGDKHLTGLHVLLEASYGQFKTHPDIQRSALNSIINCVSINSPNVDAPSTSTQQGTYRSIDEWLNKMYKNVQFKNGIVVLFNIVFVKKPLVQDSVRALACRALCGLARSQYVKDIMNKLPLVVSGKLLDLVKQPLIQDKAHHENFCKYVYEFIKLMFGTSASIYSETSLLGINTSEIADKTQISYDGIQLLQLISHHLSSKGLTETATVLQREMSEKYPTSINIPLVDPTAISCKNITIGSSVPQISGNRKMFVSPSHNSLSYITPIPSTSVSLVATSNKMQVPSIEKQTVLNPIEEFQSSVTLDTIVTEYLRKQHSKCKNPMLTCPPFDLYSIHRCPEPRHKRNADGNFLRRFQKQQMAYPNGGYGGSILDRKLIYSRYKHVRSFRAEIMGFTACCFLNCLADDPQSRIMAGTREFVGCSKLRLFNINTGKLELSEETALKTISNIESSKHETLAITSDGSRMGGSELWNIKGNFHKLYNFSGVRHFEFGKTTASRMVGTKDETTILYDTSTCEPLDTYTTTNVGNGYVGNKATFDYFDEIILSDGILWDVRSKNMIHKLDKFNSSFNGVFHPNGREVVSNTEIWDVRTFKLLRTVPYIDQFEIRFNDAGTVIYGVCCCLEEQVEKMNCFYTFDACDYSPIAMTDVKRPVLDISLDIYERYIATIESHNRQSEDLPFPALGIEPACRLYEIGKEKEDEENGKAEIEEDLRLESENERSELEAAANGLLNRVAEMYQEDFDESIFFLTSFEN